MKDLLYVAAIGITMWFFGLLACEPIHKGKIVDIACGASKGTKQRYRGSGTPHVDDIPDEVCWE